MPSSDRGYDDVSADDFYARVDLLNSYGLLSSAKAVESLSLNVLAPIPKVPDGYTITAIATDLQIVRQWIKSRFSGFEFKATAKA